jgi:hypothetical protein
MVESIYFLKPAWCGDHLAGLRPEQGFQPVTRAVAFRRWFVTSGIGDIVLCIVPAGFHEDGLSGRVGDAAIVGGEVRKVPGGLTRWFVRADCEITLKLEGELVRGTGVRRGEFRLYVTPVALACARSLRPTAPCVFHGRARTRFGKSMMVQTLQFTLRKMP